MKNIVRYIGDSISNIPNIKRDFSISIFAIIFFSIFNPIFAACLIGALAVVDVIYLLVLCIKYLFLYKESIITYKNFKSFLESQYRVTNNVQKNIELQLSNIVHDIFFRTKIPNSINDEFKKLLDALFSGFNSSSVWSCDVSDSNLESRKNVKFSKNEFLKIHEIYGIDNFTLSFRNGKLHFTPFICFYEKDKNISIINWNRICIEFKGTQSLEESYREIKGAEPIYHIYLHQRVDGGPDRRYNYNPSTPVYRHSIYRVVVEKDEFNIVFANRILGEQFSNLINTYQGLIKNFRSQMPIGVNNLDVSKDEIASLFREIIVSKGTQILDKNVFVSILSDYKVFREKTNMRKILKALSDDNYWKDILSPDCTYYTLNEISDKLISSHNFDEKETLETLAYIGYGLQLKK